MPELPNSAISSTRNSPLPETSINLRRVPQPLAGNDRYPWRLMSILVALRACRGNSATVEQLHTLVWALRDEINAEIFTSEWNRSGSKAAPFRGYEPDLLGTLRLAHTDGLVLQASSGRQHLTEAGDALLSAFRETGGSLGEQETAIYNLSPISATVMWRRLGSTN